MGEWWTTVPTGTSMGNYEISSISHVTMSPSRQNNFVSMYSSMPLSKSSYSVISAFCTEDNIPQCISYMNQELASLGLSSTCIEASSPGGAGLNAVPALNAMYEMLQIYRRNMCALTELENEQLKKSSSLEHMQMNNSRLKACIYPQNMICMRSAMCRNRLLTLEGRKQFNPSSFPQKEMNMSTVLQKLSKGQPYKVLCSDISQ